MISTGRFFCRPSGSSEPSGFLLGATGFFAPNPCIANCALSRPSLSVSKAATAGFALGRRWTKALILIEFRGVDCLPNGLLESFLVEVTVTNRFSELFYEKIRFPLVSLFARPPDRQLRRDSAAAGTHTGRYRYV